MSDERRIEVGTVTDAAGVGVGAAVEMGRLIGYGSDEGLTAIMVTYL
ncbi:hypothetical protein K3X41_05865 [Aliiroseovarius crassostreae]|nr:hypothetical protein [Aliiroseovarius crassostreae]UWQ12190.1 hypothetical protein K3X41_05865 [Aliiroseovarius crassostreae]